MRPVLGGDVSAGEEVPPRDLAAAARVMAAQSNALMHGLERMTQVAEEAGAATRAVAEVWADVRARFDEAER